MTPALESELAALGPDGKLAEGFRRNADGWDERFGADPELTRLDFSIARCAHILLSEHPSSPQAAEAIREDRLYRDRRQALLAGRAAKASPQRAHSRRGTA